jgi:hypothetical protein
MTDDRSLSARLPGPLGELARCGHGGAALRLVREWGGTKRSVPGRLREPSPLVELIGAEAAAALIDICGPCRLDIPSRACLEDTLKAKVLLAEGTTREIAVATGATERYVRMTRNAGMPATWTRPRRAKPKDERQTDLVDWLSGTPSASK